MKFTLFFFYWVNRTTKVKQNMEFQFCSLHYTFDLYGGGGGEIMKTKTTTLFNLCFFNLSFFIYQMIQIYLSHFIVLLWPTIVQYLNVFLYNVIFSSLFLFPEISVILFLFLLTFTFHTYLLFLSLSLLCQYVHLISFIWILFWYITFYSL